MLDSKVYLGPMHQEISLEMAALKTVCDDPIVKARIAEAELRAKLAITRGGLIQSIADTPVDLKGTIADAFSDIMEAAGTSLRDLKALWDIVGARGEGSGNSNSIQDVLIVPGIGKVNSRAEVQIETVLARGMEPIRGIFIPANMGAVGSDALYRATANSGMLPWIHRYAIQPGESPDDINARRLSTVKAMPQSVLTIGLNGKDRELVSKAHQTHKLTAVCIDCAHGAMQKVGDTVRQLKSDHPNLIVIAGNIATPEQYLMLLDAGADAVKVGIGPGEACTTRLVAGVGVPQFAALSRIGLLKRALGKRGIPFIADGGVKTPAHAAVCLATGACAVMMGSVFAKTAESGGEKCITYKDRDREPLFIKAGDPLPEINWRDVEKLEVLYYGQASGHAQELNPHLRGSDSSPTPEGAAKWVPIRIIETAKGCRPITVADVVREYEGGVKSAVSYVGGETLYDLPSLARYEICSIGAHVESKAFAS